MPKQKNVIVQKTSFISKFPIFLMIGFYQQIWTKLVRDRTGHGMASMKVRSVPGADVADSEV
ncbi:hypothetical protein [[Enterobacter] lignolyticus]|uniref:Uncharacterized protein n=1 Tax=[Enterobacter] lignolyticus TaxID=1334193 RepID=A0A806X4I5_9ENTR|nr:hypothetical protein [[Enterobacter] lignolyticus]ALR76504.1 hypothetical protein AO703_09395 [[Enterobacter] lignolyticus]